MNLCKTGKESGRARSNTRMEISAVGTSDVWGGYISPSKIDITDFQTIKFNISIYGTTNSSWRNGELYLFINDEPQIPPTMYYDYLNYSWDNYPNSIELDVSDYEGSYYIGVFWKGKSLDGSGSIYAQNSASIYGE